MTVLCRAYTSHEDARASVKALLDAGVRGEGVHVLSGAREHDVRDEPVGDFAGTEPADEEVADFAGREHARGAGMGSFAGDASMQREGSFADLDRDVETTYPGGVEHHRVARHHDLQRLLTSAGLDDATARTDVDALQHGRILVLVDTGDADEREVIERMDRAGH